MSSITIRILIASFAFLSIIQVEVQAQKGWEVGGWLGLTYYFGDLNTNFQLFQPGIAGGFNGRYNFNDRISTKLSLNYARIHADDADSKNTFEQQRNLSFKSAILDATWQLEFNFLPYVHGSSDQFFTPYIAGGFSGFYFNPRASLDNGETYSLRNFGTEGQAIGEEYSRINGALFFGGGFKWDINNKWSLNIEAGSRQVFTDYLDDVSTVYPDFQRLESQRGAIAVQLSNRALVPGIGEEGRQRGNSRDNDSYNFIGISLMRYFGRLECPKISDF